MRTHLKSLLLALGGGIVVTALVWFFYRDWEDQAFAKWRASGRPAAELRPRAETVYRRASGVLIFLCGVLACVLIPEITGEHRPESLVDIIAIVVIAAVCGAFGGNETGALLHQMYDQLYRRAKRDEEERYGLHGED